MTTDTETVSLKIIADQLKYMREDIGKLSDKLDSSNENKVSHREWAQRNEHVNNRMTALGREIGDLRIEVRSKSAPWWSVGAMLIAGLALVWNILGPLLAK